MRAVPVLFHYREFEPLWQQAQMIQAGPHMGNGPDYLHVATPNVEALREALFHQGKGSKSVLLHYSDPIVMRSAPLRGLRRWSGPKLLICGDLHHGPDPIGTLAAYLQAEPHDAVVLTFNPAMLHAVRQRISVPVRCLPPTLFRYPSAKPCEQPLPELLHVGSLGPYHPVRRNLVTTLQARGRVPFRHASPGAQHSPQSRSQPSLLRSDGRRRAPGGVRQFLAGRRTPRTGRTPRCVLGFIAR